MSGEPESDHPLAWTLGFDPPEELLPGEEQDLARIALALREAALMQGSALPEPDPVEIDALIGAISALAPAAESPFAGELSRAWARQKGGLARMLAAVQPLVRILSRPFWVASAALVASGLPLLSADLLGSHGVDLTYGAYLVLIAPLLAVVGVAHAFRSSGTGMAELEFTCPLTPAQLILGRLFWVTAYDALLLGGASLLSVSFEPGLQLGMLVLGWLMPMLMSALAVLTLSLYVPPWVGGGIALALWALALGLLLIGRDLPLAVLAGTAVILPVAAICGGGLLLLAGLAVALWPKLTARISGLGTGGAI
jgi:hypothetical protein